MKNIPVSDFNVECKNAFLNLPKLQLRNRGRDVTALFRIIFTIDDHQLKMIPYYPRQQSLTTEMIVLQPAFLPNSSKIFPLLTTSGKSPQRKVADIKTSQRNIDTWKESTAYKHREKVK